MKFQLHNILLVQMLVMLVSFLMGCEKKSVTVDNEIYINNGDLDLSIELSDLHENLSDLHLGPSYSNFTGRYSAEFGILKTKLNSFGDVDLKYYKTKRWGDKIDKLLGEKKLKILVENTEKQILKISFTPTSLAKHEDRQ